jgi:subtilisin family serine protease
MKVKKKYYITAILVIFGLVVTNATGSIEQRSLNVNNFDIDEDDEIISVLVFLKDQVDLKEITRQMDEQGATLQKRHEVTVVSLQDTAYSSQPQLVEYLNELENQKIVKEYKPYWISNVIRVDTYQCVVDNIAKRSDVLKVYPNFEIELIEPISKRLEDGSDGRDDIEPGVVAVRAPEVWDMGITGAGVLVATLDTGVDGNHPALADRWAGVADPNYEGHPEWAWFDPYAGQNDFPYDNHGHGTHTMGSVCGGAPGDQIGVAPGAYWISAAPIDRGGGIPQTVADAIESFEWMIDPDGDPSTNWDVPDVCSNSWRVTTGHGYPPCDDLFWSYLDACEAVGTVIIFAAGNEGSGGLGRPSDRATDDYRTFAVAAVDANDPSWPIAYFSSRGPTYCTPDGSEAIKPDIAGPGVDVRSSMPGGGYGYMSGTSMSTPHLNGVVALMREAAPDMSVEEIKEIIYQTAYDLGEPGEDNSYGWGMVDVYEAVLRTNMNPDIPDIEGPSNGYLGISYEFTFTSQDPEDDDICYMIDWGDGNCTDWIGPCCSGECITESHSWIELGTCQIKVKAKDNEYGDSGWSEPFNISIDNRNPDKPIISGPNTVKPKISIDYTFSCLDPDGHDVYFLINWGDGTYINYEGPYASGEEVTYSHAWGNLGDYMITTKTKDEFGLKSSQGNLKITISNTRETNRPFFNLLFKNPNIFPILIRLISLWRVL